MVQMCYSNECLTLNRNKTVCMQVTYEGEELSAGLFQNM